MRFIAVDTETTGLNIVDDKIRLISWCDENGSGASANVAEIADLLKDKEVVKVFHYAMFDVPFLIAKGYEVNNYQCTHLLSKIIDFSADHRLAAVAKTYLGVEVDKSLQHSDNWNEELTDKHIEYAKFDAELTYKLFPILRQKINENFSLLKEYEINMDALKVLVKVRVNGFRFSLTEWDKQKANLQAEVEAIKEEMILELENALADEDDIENIRKYANFNSYIDVLNIFGLLIPKLKSTADAVLAKHSHIKGVKLLREYRTKYKLAYGNDGFVKYISSNGKVHPNWNAIGAVTGRMSCSKPNIQQIPSSLKRFFIADEGYKIISIDYSQVELRIAAYMSSDEAMINAFEKGEDLHLLTAKVIFSKDKISKEERGAAKEINFGLLYGMTPKGLSVRLSNVLKEKVSVRKCERFIEKYFRHYKKLKRWLDKQKRKSEICTTLGKKFKAQRLSTMQRANYPIQGTGAEVMKTALILLDQLLPNDVKILAVVHDEVVIQAPEPSADAVKTLAENCMDRGFKSVVNIKSHVESNVGYNWQK
ncbi:DNA polymerase [Mycoplasmatota bacterium WC44]